MRERGFWLDNNRTVFFGSQEYYSEYTSVFVVSALWLVGLLSSVICACVSPRDAAADTRKVIIAS